jgi:hypothetical protein
VCEAGDKKRAWKMDIVVIDLAILILVVSTSLWGLLGASRIALPFILFFVVTTLIYNWPSFAALFTGEPLGKILLLFFVLFLSLICFGILARLILSGIKGITQLGPYNRVVGVIMGAVLGIYLSGFFVWGIQKYEVSYLQTFVYQSKFAHSFELFFYQLMNVIVKLLPQHHSPFYGNL